MTATAFRISHCKLDRVKNKALQNPTDDKLRAIALAYPGAIEDHPWGHSAFKVNKKVFLFLGSDEEGVGLSVKLPRSGATALLFPFAKPTGYGLGKSGWVSCKFSLKEKVPLSMLKEWIDESYRAIAPKKLIAQLTQKAG
jgi:predicted DNA-binding protein (MmcQ/YjbR family)